MSLATGVVYTAFIRFKFTSLPPPAALPPTVTHGNYKEKEEAWDFLKSCFVLLFSTT